MAIGNPTDPPWDYSDERKTRLVHFHSSPTAVLGPEWNVVKKDSPAKKKKVIGFQLFHDCCFHGIQCNPSVGMLEEN